MRINRNKRLLLSMFQSLLIDTDDLLFVKNAELVYIAASQPFARMVGLTSADELIGKTDFDIFEDKELAKRYTDDDKRMIDTDKPLRSFIEPIPSEHGKPRFAQTQKSLIRDRRGRVIGVYGIARDVTREYEAKLNYERERRYLLELPKDAYRAALLDVTEWRILEFRESERALGYMQEGMPLDTYACDIADAILEGDSARRFFQDFTREHVENVFGDGIRNLVFKYKRRMEDGSDSWVREELHLMINPSSLHLEALVVLRDIDEQMREMDMLVRAAEQDSMTGLLNHEATLDYIRLYLQNEGAQGTHAIFMIDIDNFKNVNDTYGHQHGDVVIVGVASAIRGAFRDTDVVGRIGGDEFLALMKNVDQPAVIQQKAARIVDTLHGIHGGDKVSACLSGSVGVAVYRGDGKTLETLYAEADAALYRAKHNGKNGYDIAQ